jgi:hypothetical protein
VSSQFGWRDETCPVSTGGEGRQLRELPPLLRPARPAGERGRVVRGRFVRPTAPRARRPILACVRAAGRGAGAARLIARADVRQDVRDAEYLRGSAAPRLHRERGAGWVSGGVRRAGARPRGLLAPALRN